jgi:hypothetical protein
MMVNRIVGIERTLRTTWWDAWELARRKAGVKVGIEGAGTLGQHG